jgi:hypothetical protein
MMLGIAVRQFLAGSGAATALAPMHCGEVRHSA